MEEKEYYYFTFGCGQENERCYVKIDGNISDSRELMFKMFGDKWAFQYSAKDWENYTHPLSGEKGTQASVYNLKELVI